MANVFLNLPVTAGNGVGVAVDTSTLGATKTITVSGTGFSAALPFQASVSIEFSLGAGAPFQTIHTFTGPEKKTFKFAANFMRVRVQGFVVGVGMSVEVGGTDIGSQFASLPAPATDGVGAQVDVSALGTFNTFLVGGAFTGSVTIEASEDGIDWNPCAGFSSPGGSASRDLVARFMRVRREGSDTFAPGLPTINVGAANDATSGGSGASAGQPNCLVFREGSGLVGPVVFGAWADLITELGVLRAAANASGCYRIEFDNSVTPAMTVPAGAYDMSNVEWTTQEDRSGPLAAGSVPVTIPEGVVLTGMRSFSGPLFILCTAVATVPIADMVNGEQITLRDGAILDAGAGAVPFIRLSALGAGEFVTIDMGQVSAIGVGGAAVVVDVPVAATFLALNFGTQSVVGAGAISGIAGSTVIRGTLASSTFFGQPQAAFLGAFSDNLQTHLRLATSAVIVAPFGGMQLNAWVQGDVSGGGFTQTLPPLTTASENPEGNIVVMSEVSGTAGLLAGPVGIDTINGAAATFPIPPGGSVAFICAGRDWRVLAIFDPGAVAAQANCLVFRPGSGLTGPVIFDTWAAVNAAIVAQRGVGDACFTVMVDDSIVSPAVVPAGAYDLTGVSIVGAIDRDSGPVAVTVVEGVTFTTTDSGYRFANVGLTFSGATPPITLLAGQTLRLSRAGRMTTSGAGEFVVTSLAALASATILLEEGSRVDTGSVPVIDHPSNGASLVLVVQATGTFAADVLTGGGDATAVWVRVAIDPGAIIDIAQPAFVGIRSNVCSDRARWMTQVATRVAGAVLTLADVGQAIRGDTGAGAFDLTLPPAASVFPGEGILLFQVAGSAGELGFIPAGADTINGVAAAVKLSSSTGALWAFRDDSAGVNWLVRELGGIGSAVWVNDGANVTLIAGPRAMRNISAGNARGANALDWQAVQAAVTQVASGARSAIPAGQNNTASGDDSLAMGNNAVSDLDTQQAIASGSFGLHDGDAQSTDIVVFRGPIAPNTPTVLTIGGGAQAAGNSLVMVDDTTWLIEARLAIADNVGPNSAGVIIRGVFRRETGVATVVQAGITEIDSIATTLTYTAVITFTANVVLGSVDIGVDFQGEAVPGDTLNVVAHVRIVEVGEPAP